MFYRKRKCLLLYWSVRYFLTMIVSMALVITITLFAIEKNALSNQYHGMEQMVRAIGMKAAKAGGRLPLRQSDLESFLLERAEQYGLNTRPFLFILNREGRVIQQFPSSASQEYDQLSSRMSDIMAGGGTHIITLEPPAGKDTNLLAVEPFGGSPSSPSGYVLYMIPKEDVLRGILRFKPQRLIVFITTLLSGWGIIYLMTRRLVKPIREAAAAAEQIVAGNYNIHFDKDFQEKEVYELMHAFKEMAQRLNRLEELRTQLLAGVTHELKTPVASISGLIQAVKDRVVNGEEAVVFLDHCLKQTGRLQKMVEDLLDFNRFAANTVVFRKEMLDLKKVIGNIIARWRMVQNTKEVDIVLEVPEQFRVWKVVSDPIRIEQIVVNLLNNAKEAIRSEGMICVWLIADLTAFRIQVRDTGCGIPPEEQANIFEPFYRGHDKKKRILGLGLGLPFSKLIARSLEGDLTLTASDSEGTIFTLSIPREISALTSG